MSQARLERKNIGIFGRVNVGKSTLMNLLTESDVSIVDKKPGTTADIKTAFMEIHEMGPIKIFDTAGFDEKGELGEKKKQKSLMAIKECDLLLLIIDPFSKRDLLLEKMVADLAKERKKDLFILFNIFKKKEKNSSLTKEKAEKIACFLNNSKFLMSDFSENISKKLIGDFILSNFKPKNTKVEFFSKLKIGDIVFLNIPLDEESPEGRLLRPQALVQEKLIRRYISTFAYRMDLKKARSKVEKERLEEQKRFIKALDILRKSNDLKLVITDSSAIDIVHKWTMERGKPLLPITTFSVIMAHITSGGRIKEFVSGLRGLKSLKKGDRILIAEACNHNRIAEDIGTVQIPKMIKKAFGEGIIIDHLFGKEFSKEDLKSYKLVIHCGGCMLDKQRIEARLEDLAKAKVPFTNYGIFLSYMQSEEALKRVVEPFL